MICAGEKTSIQARCRPVRGHHRDRAVRPAGGAGDDHRTVRQREPGVLDRGQWLLPPRRRRDPADGQHLAERAADPPARARLLAGPGGNLLLRRPAQSPHPNDFTGLDQIRDRLAAFETRYNAIARPFSWKFTRTDLSDLLRRIDAHDKTKTHALAA